MKRFWLMSSILLAAPVLLIGGCSQAPLAVEDDEYAGPQYPRVVVNNSELRPYLATGEPIVSGGPESPWKVVVPIRATSDVALNISYKFEFFDEQGFPMKPEQDWKYLRLLAKTQRFMEGASLDRGVSDWRVIIRPAP